jgi:hypothetical protein
MTTNPAPTNPPPARRPPWVRLLYVLLLLSGVFAAWQAHEVWQSSPGEPPRKDAPRVNAPVVRIPPRARPMPLLPTRPAASSQSQPATGLGDLANDLFPDSSVAKLDGDPVDIAPPPGASGLKAFSLPGGGVMAQYVWRGSVQGAAKHYLDTLADQGCKLLDNSVDEKGQQSLKFRGDGPGDNRRVIVALRTNPQDEKMVLIEVTVIRPSK